MKYFYILFQLLLISGITFSQYGQIPNGGFENWNNNVIFNSPSDWKSSNTDQFYGTPTVSLSPEAFDGTFSVLLNIVQVLGSVNDPAYVYHGNKGPFGPISGIPYTDNFETVRVAFKANLEPGDTLNLQVIRYLGGSVVETTITPITSGINTVWTSQDMNIGNQAQDSLYISIFLGDPNYFTSPNINSWAMIDNIQLLSSGSPTTNLPNHSFENWDYITVENPDDWYSNNFFVLAKNEQLIVKTTDSYTGNYALEMATKTIDGDVTVGFTALGIVDYTNPAPTYPIPYSATPITISGAYKYSTLTTDTAKIQFLFYNAGIVIGRHTENLTSNNVYTTFNSTFNNPIIGIPDSMVFVIGSGLNPGSVLKLDDLQFNGGNVSLEELLSIDFDIYPNPAINNVSIKLPNSAKHSVVIQDMSGRILYNLENASGIQSIDVSNFDKGTYMVVVSNAKVNEIKKLILQ